MRIWDYYDGERRVGRDDHDYNEQTIVFPIYSNYHLKDKMIDLINEQLDIKLSLEEENCRYYSYKIYDSDWNSTFTGRKGGAISNHKYILKILTEVIKRQAFTEEYL